MLRKTWIKSWGKVSNAEESIALLTKQCKAMGKDWSVVIYWNQDIGWEVALYRASGTAEMAKSCSKSLSEAAMQAARTVLDDPISGVTN